MAASTTACSQSSNAVSASPTTKYNNILQVIQDHYLDGLRQGDPSQIAHIFQQDAIMYGYSLEGSVPFVPALEYDSDSSAGIASGAVMQIAQSARTRLDIVDVTPTTAVVRVDIRDAGSGMGGCTEYHTVVKFDDGKWCVLATTVQVNP